MKITQEQVKNLNNDDITKKEHDRTLDKIHSRFCEIIETIYKIHTGKTKLPSWYDFDNLNWDGEVDGYFDPDCYETDICISHDIKDFPYLFLDGFPTKWLWEDFEEECLKELNQFEIDQRKKKKQEKENRDNRKITKKDIHSQIEAKLTKEELKYVKFK